VRFKFNRRELLSAGVAAGTAATLSGDRAAARTITGEIPWTPGEANKPDVAIGQDYQFLTAEEAKFIEAAVARLIPADDLGPGAKEAGAALFIDRQLFGVFGAATNWYMQGPWADGQESQGYQSRMTPAELYRGAIKAVDVHCRKTFGGNDFAALSVEEQDQVLAGLEKSEVKLDMVKAKTFFELLLQNTIEGFFSDPIYGGNRHMVGWKLIGFPGARYDYRPYVKLHNQRLSLAPVGIVGRAGWNPSKS
jgi:gluconate 2-dehydrogenase gamma chain